MSNDQVRAWFEGRFEALHPMLQKLHTHGGTLRGEVEIVYGVGMAGFIGRRLARKLKVPDAGSHELSVQVSHHADGLHWDRCFDGATEMKSVFTPVGVIDVGYWLEQTGPLKMHLTVDIEDGGWYWRCLRFRFLGVPLPVWVFPHSQAYKKIENGLYRFYVGFSFPLLGTVLSYGGLLKAEYAE